LYRVLFEWMATPERYAKYGPKPWSTYYDSGEVTIELQPDGLRALAFIRNWRSHHPLICELNRGAGVEVYAAMGCREVTNERARCVSRGDPHCRFITRWRQKAKG
jgi:predicted hydrocarbon binding protein